MKPVIVHVLTSFTRGGAELGINTLIENNFYEHFDLHVVGLIQGNGGIYEYFAKRLGADRVHCLTDKDSLPRIRDLPLLFSNLFKTLQTLKPKVLILSLVGANFVGRFVATLFPKIHVITFEHNAQIQNLLLRATSFFMSSRVNAIFGDTPDTLRQAKAYYPLRKPAHVVPLIHLETDGITPRSKEVPLRFNILSLGRLAPQKNYFELVRAAALLKQKGYAFNIAIDGEGPQRKKLECEIKRLGLNDCVQLRGFIGDTEVLARHRAEAHIYVQPSLHEGFCIATAEAMGAGMVVVATDFNGLRDYGTLTNHIQIEGFSAEKIAKALQHCMDNYDELAPLMSRSALRTAESNFSGAIVREQWERAKQQLLAAAHEMEPQRSAVFQKTARQQTPEKVS
ncbi:MAG: glycosyltransferase [Alphaproteobacteria bacterium]